MELSRKQKALLHQVPTRLGISEAERRLIQWNAGGFYSAADKTVTRAGFIGVMALYERLAGGSLASIGLPHTAGYWAAELARACPADALRFHLMRLAAEVGLTGSRLDAWIAGDRLSHGACTGVADAPPYWLQRAVEGVKAMRRRQWAAGRPEPCAAGSPDHG